MKCVYLLRHAKSSWAESGVSDQQRPLNKRGMANAPVMGERFLQRGEQLDHIVSSPALRARTTAQLFAKNCGFARTEIGIDADLYFLGSGSVESAILAQDNQHHSLMLVFHNPDITEFVNSIDYEFHIDNMPTCGLVKFNCDIAHWRDFSPATATFDYYDFPKNDAGTVLSLH